MLLQGKTRGARQRCCTRARRTAAAGRARASVERAAPSRIHFVAGFRIRFDSAAERGAANAAGLCTVGAPLSLRAEREASLSRSPEYLNQDDLRGRIRITVQAGEPMTVQGDGAGPRLSPLPGSCFSPQHRRANFVLEARKPRRARTRRAGVGA
jgi:hypothetical protein